MTQHANDEFHDIRDAVDKLFAKIPGEYWRKLDRQMAYPKEFVKTLTEAGSRALMNTGECG